MKVFALRSFLSLLYYPFTACRFSIFSSFYDDRRSKLICVPSGGLEGQCGWRIIEGRSCERS